MENAHPSKPPGTNSRERLQLLVETFFLILTVLIFLLCIFMFCVCIHRANIDSVRNSQNLPISQPLGQTSTNKNNDSTTVACTYFQKMGECNGPSEIGDMAGKENQFSHKPYNQEDDNGFVNIPLEESVILIEESSSSILYKNTRSDKDDIHIAPPTGNTSLCSTVSSSTRSLVTSNYNLSRARRPQSVTFTPASLDIMPTSYSPVYNHHNFPGRAQDQPPNTSTPSSFPRPSTRENRASALEPLPNSPVEPSSFPRPSTPEDLASALEPNSPVDFINSLQVNLGNSIYYPLSFERFQLYCSTNNNDQPPNNSTPSSFPRPSTPENHDSALEPLPNSPVDFVNSAQVNWGNLMYYPLSFERFQAYRSTNNNDQPHNTSTPSSFPRPPSPENHTSPLEPLPNSPVEPFSFPRPPTPENHASSLEPLPNSPVAFVISPQVNWGNLMQYPISFERFQTYCSTNNNDQPPNTSTNFSFPRPSTHENNASSLEPLPNSLVAFVNTPQVNWGHSIYYPLCIESFQEYCSSNNNNYLPPNTSTTSTPPPNLSIPSFLFFPRNSTSSNHVSSRDTLPETPRASFGYVPELGFITVNNPDSSDPENGERMEQIENPDQRCQLDGSSSSDESDSSTDEESISNV